MAQPLPANKKYNPKKGRIGGVIFGGIFAATGCVAAGGILFDDHQDDLLFRLLMAGFFLLVFGGLGVFLIRYALKKTNLQQELDKIRREGIASDQKSGHKPFMVFALIFSLPGIGVVLAGLFNMDAGAFAGFPFLLIGLGLHAYGNKQKRTYQIIGPTLLKPDPLPVVIGHQFGGSFSLSAKPRNGLTLRLSCLHTYSSGSGDSRTTHTSVLHQQETRAYIEAGAGGQQHIRFLFELPDDLPESGCESYRGTVSWQLTAEGQVTTERKVPGTQIAELMEFKRSWDLPVLSLAFAEALGIQLSRSNVAIPEQHQQEVRAEQRQQANDSVERQIDMSTQPSGATEIISEAGRNKSMWGVLLAVGAIFGAIGVFLFYLAQQKGGELWFMASVFSLVGWGMFFFALFLLGRKLETYIDPDQAGGCRVRIIRSVFGRQLYQRNGRITSPSQLELKMTMSSTSQDHVKTEYMAIYANLDGKNIKLAEGIEGSMAGEAMLAKIKAALTQRLDDELI
ncbi:hypothetical protein [Bacterioplanoides sp.]|uniref:hypothetical protein n=1 Tax=Bacterioplanoides sp. TaxID=2066072 RepID=UPI003AFFEA80